MRKDDEPPMVEMHQMAKDKRGRQAAEKAAARGGGEGRAAATAGRAEDRLPTRFNHVHYGRADCVGSSRQRHQLAMRRRCLADALNLHPLSAA
jgi:hypothetical protein